MFLIEPVNHEDQTGTSTPLNRSAVVAPRSEFLEAIGPTTHSLPDDDRLEISVAPHDVL